MSNAYLVLTIILIILTKTNKTELNWKSTTPQQDKQKRKPLWNKKFQMCWTSKRPDFNWVSTKKKKKKQRQKLVEHIKNSTEPTILSTHICIVCMWRHTNIVTTFFSLAYESHFCNVGAQRTLLGIVVATNKYIDNKKADNFVLILCLL